MKHLKLGVIGMSPGNGHPYSWSAIFNGYNDAKMKECPFPVIYKYLSQQNFPADGIPGATVTHIWTQDLATSRYVAEASKIQTVVPDSTAMIGQVDAVLLARDDAETHYDLAKPFLKAGLPVYIDKPLAYTVHEARRILDLETYAGQIYTCSGVRFSKDLRLTLDQKEKVGKVLHILGSVPKDWKKYAIHAIDPVLQNFPDLGAVKKSKAWNVTGNVTLNVLWESGMQGTFFNFGIGASPIQLQLIGDRGTETLVFKNTFAAFKSSLEKFIESVRERRRIIPLADTMMAIELIEKGAGDVQ